MRWPVLLAIVAACAGSKPPPPPTGDVEPAGRLGGELIRLELAGETIARRVPGDGGDAWLSPPVIDSHVHLVIWPVAERLAASGVAAVVDLAAPERTLGELARAPIRVIAAGPMLTREDGYPLSSWGSDGYGIGCADSACVIATIKRHAAAGATIVKVALDDDGLDPRWLPIAVKVAHDNQMRVAVHALTDASARVAAEANADLLAHTPVEPLAAATVQAWRGKAVISTLAAFGGSPEAIANLRALRAAGVTVLYGTDLGNLRDAGPSAAEIALLERAGLDAAAITAAMTTAPAAYWNLPLASLAAGTEASFLVLDRDPHADARAFLAPRAVWLRGRRLR